MSSGRTYSFGSTFAENVSGSGPYTEPLIGIPAAEINGVSNYSWARAEYDRARRALEEVSIDDPSRRGKEEALVDAAEKLLEFEHDPLFDLDLSRLESILKDLIVTTNTMAYPPSGFIIEYTPSVLDSIKLDLVLDTPKLDDSKK